jgi:hypothetical protein
MVSTFNRSLILTMTSSSFGSTDCLHRENWDGTIRGKSRIARFNLPRPKGTGRSNPSLVLSSIYCEDASNRRGCCLPRRAVAVSCQLLFWAQPLFRIISFLSATMTENAFLTNDSLGITPRPEFVASRRARMETAVRIDRFGCPRVSQ